MHKTKIVAALLLAAGCFAAPAHAVDGVSVEAGTGNSNVDAVRLGAQWKWQKKWFTDGDWHVGGYWEAQMGYWNAAKDIVDFSVTPVFRLEQKTLSGMAPYFEAAIGFHYLSSKQARSNRTFSTNFQFGDHIGAGVRLGERYRHDVSLRLQHLSNAGIKSPNPGINFALLRYQYHFE
jgi:lipid A 3-O-deacylase